MRYAALGPGKRIRPVLTLAVAEMLGARDLEPVADLGAAVELVHAASLVLDDLPAMDDAVLRRGRPATHRQFGEEVALLAAFALLNRAHALVAAAGARLALARRTAADFVLCLAAAVGPGGLVGGQAEELASRPGELDAARLESIHAGKTGSLFRVAAELGAMAADAPEAECAAVARYAGCVGVAFQVEDDRRDAEAAAGGAGKERRRSSAVDLLGFEAAGALAAERLAQALAALAPFGARAEPLRALAAAVLAPPAT